MDDKVAAINLDIGSNLTLVAGSSVNVICEVEGVPDPRITWKQNGNQVLRNINKTFLNVENPDRINLHSISCTADNVLGDDTKTSYFTILGKNLRMMYYSVMTQAYSEKEIPSSPNRSRTYDLPITSSDALPLS